MSVRQDVLRDRLKLDDRLQEDAHTAQERSNNATVVRRLYWSLIILSMFVPCMGVLFKLTMHPQLSKYYSAAYQASIGHLDPAGQGRTPPPSAKGQSAGG